MNLFRPLALRCAGRLLGVAYSRVLASAKRPARGVGHDGQQRVRGLEVLSSLPREDHGEDAGDALPECPQRSYTMIHVHREAKKSLAYVLSADRRRLEHSSNLPTA